MKLVGRHSIGRLVLIMVVVVIIGVVVARNYYTRANGSVDPRIIPARELYAQYDSHAGSGNYYEIFELLDSIERIYQNVAHYRTSFELGVLENNRAAAFLTIALHGDSIQESSNPWSSWSNDTLVLMAEKHLREAISIYENWIANYGNRSKQQIRAQMEAQFMEGLEGIDPDVAENYIKTRLMEIEKALQENSRRLSVCYSNLGLVYRFQGAFAEAARNYETALNLWDRNLDAENNLNRLLNRPVKKRNFIQKMFPPDREQK